MKKKILSLLLALVMIAAMAMPVFADDDGYTITINDSKTGHTYQGYQIFDGDVSGSADAPILANITWGNNINGDAFLSNLKQDETMIYSGDGTTYVKFSEIFASCTSAKDVADKLEGWGNSGSRIKRFAQIAAQNLKTTDATIYTATYDNENKNYVLTVPAGYYLIKDVYGEDSGTLVDDFYTGYILCVTNNSTVAVKGSVPTVKKEVSTSTTGYTEGVSQETGRQVYYRLSATLPANYAEYTDYYFAFSDTMSAGLTFDGVYSIKVDYNNTTNSAGYPDVTIDYTTEPVTTQDAQGYKPKITSSSTSDSTTVTVEWTDLKEVFTYLQAGDTIEVVLQATLNTGAVIGLEGNTNEVHIEYSNDPNGTGKGMSSSDYAYVYTWEMDVMKTVEGGKDETASTLSGAEFILIRKAGNGKEYYAQIDSNNKISGWVEHYDGDSCVNGHGENTKFATILTTQVNTMTQIDGLNSDVEYYLREVKAPEGYDKLFSDIPVEIHATINGSTGQVTQFTYDISDVETEVGKNDEGNLRSTNVVVEVENKAGSTLPTTGGIGTTIFYAVGGLLVVAAVVLLITKKRMATKN